MVGELALIVEGVPTMNKVVEGTRAAIDSIQSNKRAQNDEVKRAIADRLGELQRSMAQVAALADAAEDYGRALENINELLWLCRRAERVVAEKVGQLEQGGPGGEGIWRNLDTLRETIDALSDVPQRSVLGRIPWFDDTDEGQMKICVSQFTVAYGRASSSVRHRVVAGCTTSCASWCRTSRA